MVNEEKDADAVGGPAEEEEAEDLAARHRKEKKQLQAKIQALKKSAGSDKKKKKDALEEAARLEKEMEDKHEAERRESGSGKQDSKELTSDLSAVSVSEKPAPASASGSSEVSSEASSRVSKAQKRRDKKAASACARDAEIKAQEELNREGPRQREMDAIAAKLKQKDRRMHAVPADGDCLYAAVAHQLALVDRPDVASVSALRKMAAGEMRANVDEYIPFMTHPDTGDMLSPEEFDAYCAKVERPSIWGGQLELRAMSTALKSNIVVVQADGPDVVLGQFCAPPLIVAFHRHFYRLGEHYNSTHPVNQDA